MTIETNQALFYQEKFATAIMALEALEAQDAASICVAVLDEISAGDPVHTAFGDIRADAAFWADCANIAELEIYFCEILKRLGYRALGLQSRKSLMARIWASFNEKNRAAFLAYASKGAAA